VRREEELVGVQDTMIADVTPGALPPKVMLFGG